LLFLKLAGWLEAFKSLGMSICLTAYELDHIVEMINKGRYIH